MTETPHFERTPDGAIQFMFGDLPAGAYQINDSHKPYLHPLYTPAGHKLSLGRPHDHPHHKGLMFALVTETHNYWEEYPFDESTKVGVQRVEGPPELSTSSKELSCHHKLHWCGEDETVPQITEERTISCVLDESGEGFNWKWSSCLTPNCDTQLVKSPYSPKVGEGTLVNYHGLGIRLRREFGCTGGNGVRIGDEFMPVGDALGKTANSVTFQGSIDEIWPVPKCEVTFSSPEPFGVFAMDTPFAYLAYGPSVLETPLWRKGESINLKFAIRLADIIAEK
jgi:hypothetical protein